MCRGRLCPFFVFDQKTELTHTQAGFADYMVVFVWRHCSHQRMCRACHVCSKCFLPPVIMRCPESKFAPDFYAPCSAGPNRKIFGPTDVICHQVGAAYGRMQRPGPDAISVVPANDPVRWHCSFARRFLSAAFVRLRIQCGAFVLLAAAYDGSFAAENDTGPVLLPCSCCFGVQYCSCLRMIV